MTMSETNQELYEAREKEMLEELGKTPFNDPNRLKLVESLDTIAKIRVNYDQLDQTRLNNNAKNDIEEEKLVIEHKKIENDKERIWASVITGLVSFFGGVSVVRWSYKMDENNWAYKDMKMFGTKAIDSVKGIFKK